MVEGKDNSEPDFSDFRDWNKQIIGRNKLDERINLVKRNIALLLQRGAWKDKVDKFEDEINKIADKKEREIKRKGFVIIFDNYIFSPKEIDHHLNFINYLFPCTVSFNNVRFPDFYISFERTAFKGDISFTGASFVSRKVNFASANFNNGNVTFDGASFSKSDVSFTRAKFGNGNLSFNDTNFGDGNVIFSATDFGNGNVTFDGASFDKSDVSFTRAKFGNGNLSFNDTNFGDGDVNFNKVNFGKCNVLFEDAEFGTGHCWFTSSIFKSEYISFSRSKFAGEFRFTPNKEKSKIQSASFNDVTVAGNLTINADFDRVATFQRLDVKGSANFSGSSFKTVPDFRDMKLDRPPEVAAMEVPPEKLKMGFSPLAKYSGNKDDVAKYRKLKSMAIAASDHVKSGEFFAYEMMAKRGVETTGRFALLFNWLYGFLSGYGQSYIRPMIALFGLWLLTTIFNIWKIFQELVFVSEWDWWQNIALSFLLSAKNLTPIFNSLSRFAPSPSGYQSWFQDSMNRLKTENVNIDWLTSIGILEQFIGTIFLFLLLLGLRNAFRLK